MKKKSELTVVNNLEVANQTAKTKIHVKDILHICSVSEKIL